MTDTTEINRPVKAVRAKQTLSWVALFLGELRDGLTMINMQSAFLITSKYYTEKQAGIMFFIFGMSQFLLQTPAGYLMDYSDKKVALLATAAIGTTLLTLTTAIFAQEYGANLGFMIFIKALQGGITALIPPGLNSIAQGIVGAEGMTEQVSKNEMMNHLGTAIIVLSGSLLAFGLYPNIGMLFVVSPIACIGVLVFLARIRPGDIDHNAARGLKSTSKTTTKTESPRSDGAGYAAPMVGTSTGTGTGTGSASIDDTPSFNFGYASPTKSIDTFDGLEPETGLAQSTHTLNTHKSSNKATTPLQILRDPTLVLFVIVCFCFHMSNGTVLPLVMQTLAIANGRTGILMSGMCIIIAQAFMVLSAKICGDYSATYGRKTLFLIGLFSVPIRCSILTCLLTMKEAAGGGAFFDVLILSTQILDGVGAGVFGTMYVLVTSDISGGTGRFSLTLGLTTAAMSIGGTVSGYLGQAIAQDMGYRQAFVILGFMALLPALLYLFFMPETLPQLDETSAGVGGDAGPKESLVGKEILPMGKIVEGDEETSSKGTNSENEPTTKYNQLI